MGQTVFPLPATGNTGPTPPPGFRQSVFDGQLVTTDSATKTGSYSTGIYRLDASGPGSGALTLSSTSGDGASAAIGSFGLLTLPTGSDSITVSKAPNAVSWNSSSVPTFAEYKGVAYGNSRFIAVHSGGVITSTNAINWSTWGTFSPGSNVTGLYFGNGIFVMTLYSQVATSTDGITWTYRSLPATDFYYPGGFGGGVHIVFKNNGGGARSTDGVTWTSFTTPRAQVGYAYGNGVHVTGPMNAASFMSVSTDGITWSDSSSLPYTLAFRSITFNGTNFVTTATNSIALTSTNGTSWTANTNLPDNGGGYRTYGVAIGGQHVVARWSYSNIATSPDGVTWTIRSGTLGALGAFAVGPVGFVGIVGNGSSGTAATYSTSKPAGMVAFSLFPASSTVY